MRLAVWGRRIESVWSHLYTTPRVGSLRRKTTSESPKFLSVREAADYLRINPSTLYRMLERHEIPGAFQVGKLWRFNLDEFNRITKTRAKLTRKNK